MVRAVDGSQPTAPHGVSQDGGGAHELTAGTAIPLESAGQNSSSLHLPGMVEESISGSGGARSLLRRPLGLLHPGLSCSLRLLVGGQPSQNWLPKAQPSFLRKAHLAPRAPLYPSCSSSALWCTPSRLSSPRRGCRSSDALYLLDSHLIMGLPGRSTRVHDAHMFLHS